MTAQTYEAVLFDFDGVLVDSEPVHLACWMEVLRPFGISIDWQTYCEHYIGVDDRLMIRALCAQVNPPVPFEEAWAQYPRKKVLFESRMHRPDAIAPGIIALLRDLHQRLRIGVVTSSARSEVEPILQATGLLPFIHTAVYGDETRQHKPSPEPYITAAERLGVTRALVVEDSPAGLASGRAAGFDVLHVRRQRDMIELLTKTLRLNHDRDKPDERAC